MTTHQTTPDPITIEGEEPTVMVLMASELKPGDMVLIPGTNGQPEKQRTVKSITPHWAEGSVSIEWSPSGFSPDVRSDRLVRVARATPPDLAQELALLKRLQGELTGTDYISLMVMVGMMAEHIRTHFGDAAYNDFIRAALL